MSDLLKRAYPAFDPEPLTADPPSDALYVNLDDVRGGNSIVSRLANKIRLSKRPISQVLAGHRGSGKSTELYRLKRDLESGDDRYFTVFCTADDDVDRNDVDFFEVLVAFLRQMSRQLKERENINLKPGFFSDRWERVKDLALRTVEFKSLDLETGLGAISAIIKSSPDTRLKLRDLIEPDVGNWITAANDLIGAATLELVKKGYRGLVVLVDDLDKMILRPHVKVPCSTGEYLFIHREAQLTAFKCHVVYSMPLALAYSIQEQTIARLYGGEVPVLPMIKVRQCPPKRASAPEGVKKCRTIIEQRLDQAGLTLQQVFTDDKVVEALIQASGGQPRELMHFTREAMITELPVTAKGIERAVRDRRRAFERQLREEHRAILETVSRKGSYERDNETDGLARELLDGRAILPYTNDDEWYDLNPVIDDLYRRTPQHAQKRTKTPKKTRAKRRRVGKRG